MKTGAYLWWLRGGGERRPVSFERWISRAGVRAAIVRDEIRGVERQVQMRRLLACKGAKENAEWKRLSDTALNETLRLLDLGARQVLVSELERVLRANLRRGYQLEHAVRLLFELAEKRGT